MLNSLDFSGNKDTEVANYSKITSHSVAKGDAEAVLYVQKHHRKDEITRSRSLFGRHVKTSF